MAWIVMWIALAVSVVGSLSCGYAAYLDHRAARKALPAAEGDEEKRTRALVGSPGARAHELRLWNAGIRPRPAEPTQIAFLIAAAALGPVAAVAARAHMQHKKDRDARP